MKVFSVISFFVFAFALHFSVFSQADPPKDVLSLSGDKFSFNYPSDWELSDKSNQNFQQFNLIPKNGNALIMVIAFRSSVRTYDVFDQLKLGVSYPLIDKMLQGFTNSVRSEVCMGFSNIAVPGFSVSGLHNKKPGKGDVFNFALKEKYFQFVYMRDDEDAAKTDAAWKLLIKTFKVEGKTDDSSSLLIDFNNDTVLNGKAIELPRPTYPSEVKDSISRDVRVRVALDENGKVLSAKVIDGDQRFYLSSIEAARRAKFAPTVICGKPVKIKGIITYKFVR
ncbi:MAG: energy transducer TonB [Pyrinomonadaceae bacterium]|nr:energy transducer TonB [Pyrinomonadaceae bacterium]